MLWACYLMCLMICGYQIYIDVRYYRKTQEKKNAGTGYWMLFYLKTLVVTMHALSFMAMSTLRIDPEQMYGSVVDNIAESYEKAQKLAKWGCFLWLGAILVLGYEITFIALGYFSLW